MVRDDIPQASARDAKPPGKGSANSRARGLRYPGGVLQFRVRHFWGAICGSGSTPGRSVRDRVALQTPLGDAAAVVRAARRVGRVVYRSRRSSPLQKLDQKWRCFHTSSSISARWRNQGRAGASARAQGCWAAGSFARRRLASLLLAPDADGVGRGRLRRLRMACRGADPKTLARSETNQRCPEATLRMAKG